MSVDSESMVVIAIERLNESIDKMNDRHEKFVDKTDGKLDLIQADVNKFVVLFEKLAHMEKTHTDANKRVYHVIDEVKTRVAKIEELQTNIGCPAFNKFRETHDNELNHNVKRIDNLEADRDEAKSKPAKRWEMVLKGFFVALGASGVTYLISHWGKQ